MLGGYLVLGMVSQGWLSCFVFFHLAAARGWLLSYSPNLTKYIWDFPRRVQTRVLRQQAISTISRPLPLVMQPAKLEEFLLITLQRLLALPLCPFCGGLWPWTMPETPRLVTVGGRLPPYMKTHICSLSPPRSERKAVYSPKVPQRFECQHCDFSFSLQLLFSENSDGSLYRLA